MYEHWTPFLNLEIKDSFPDFFFSQIHHFILVMWQVSKIFIDQTGLSISIYSIYVKIWSSHLSILCIPIFALLSPPNCELKINLKKTSQFLKCISRRKEQEEKEGLEWGCKESQVYPLRKPSQHLSLKCDVIQKCVCSFNKMIKHLWLQSGVINKKNRADEAAVPHLIYWHWPKCSKKDAWMLQFVSLGSSLLPSSSVHISRWCEKRCTNREMRQGASVATTTRMSSHVCHFLKFPGAWFVAMLPGFIHLAAFSLFTAFVFNTVSLSSCGEDVILSCLCFPYLHVFS